MAKLFPDFSKVLSYPHDYTVSTASFPKLNLEKIRGELNLEERGRQNGSNNLPSPDTERLDHDETMIVSMIDTHRTQAHESFIDHLRTYAERIQALDVAGRTWEIDATVRAALSNFAMRVRQDLDQLVEARRQLLATDAQVAEFRAEHKLRRLPKHRPARAILWGIVLILFVIEIALNGAFLARGSDAGYIGGIGIAAAVALLNIFFLGLSAGRLFLPQMHHRKLWRKAAGLIGLLCYFAAMVALNLLVAHYRDALAVDLNDAPRLGLQSFLADPLGITDTQSWMLFAMGVAFSLIAMFDGLKFDDPYPGYGEVERQRLDAVDDYVETKNDLLTDLEERKEETVAALSKAREDISRRRSEYFAILDARTRMRRAFDEHLVHLEGCANDLLIQYREANEHARTAPAPSHFRQPYEIHRPPEMPFSDEVSSETVETQVGKATDRLTTAISEVFNYYDDAMSRYRRIDEIQEMNDVAASA